MQDTYTAEREREDALFFESQPYNAAAAADAEAHYLWAAGFVPFCSCFRCEAETEARYAEMDELYAWADEFAAADHPLFAMYAQARADQYELAVWEDTLHSPAGDDLPPF